MPGKYGIGFGAVGGGIPRGPDGAIQFKNSGSFSGSQNFVYDIDANAIYFTGSFYASEYHINVLSASITYESGSHKFGDSADDLHQFTGSVEISGSLTVVSGTIVGDFTAPGADTNILFNSGSAITGSSSLVYDHVNSKMGINQSSPTCGLHVGSETTNPMVALNPSVNWDTPDDAFISSNLVVKGRFSFFNPMTAFANFDYYTLANKLVARWRALSGGGVGEDRMLYGSTAEVKGNNVFTGAEFGYYAGIWNVTNFDASGSPNIIITTRTLPALRNNEYIRLGWRNGRPTILGGPRTPFGGSTPIDHDQSISFESDDGALYGLITYDGGRAYFAENQTGASSERGRVLTVSSTTDNAVAHTSTSDLKFAGIVYEGGVANGTEMPVVNGGKAYVLLEDNQAATRGNWCRTSATEAGYGDGSQANPVVGEEYRGIGIIMETKAAAGVGTHISASVLLKGA